MPHSQPTLAIVGVGLIGGSVGLGLKRSGWSGTIVGVDRAEVLQEALTLGAIDQAAPDLAAGLRHAGLVVLATPVTAIIDLLPKVAALTPADALVTDTGSTKRRILAAAHQSFGPRVRQRFLGGHPLAGRENSGVLGSDPRLFEGLPWILVPPDVSSDSDASGLESAPPAVWLEILERLGAVPIVFDAARHDQVVAALSHLPQLLSTALGAALYQQFIAGEDHREDLQVAGPGLRDMIRLAGSPYPLWRDILLTNADAIDAALGAFQQELDHLRLYLRTREIETLFHNAAEISAFVRRPHSPRKT